MDCFFSCLIYFVLFSVSLAIILLASRLKSSGVKLPPGRTGWPVIGETLEFAFLARTGKLERFTADRMKRFSPEVFRTSLLGEDVVAMCGAKGNKLLFSNEGQLVSPWWPKMVEKIIVHPSLSGNPSTINIMKSSNHIREFLKPETLKHYVGTMDTVAKMHINMYCSSNIDQEVKAYELSKKYTFNSSCRFFLNVEDPECVTEMLNEYDRLMAGFISLPIDVPGTKFNHAIKARNNLLKEIREISGRRKKVLKEKGESAAHDLLSQMLLNSDENMDIISTRINAMMLGSHETTSSSITFVLKRLAEFPDVYDAVFKEQMEIAKSKCPEELLNWNDIQKMKYSWNVVRETLRLLPPAFGGFRKALTDFTYAGFTIPKGWKIHWTTYSTHKNPKYFPDPEKFDPSRFEGNGPPPYTFVPFGGGPSICPGKEYARVQILVFIYNMVTKFKWEIVNTNEKIAFNTTPVPKDGLPIHLYPHQM